jgi:hypothetical protein
MAPALDNHPANPCVGCGPAHPWGLRLRFAREGQRVISALATTDAMQGWPGRLHSALLYLALLETANWAYYGLTDRVGVPVRTTALEAKRWVPVGEALTLAGTLATPTRVRAEALDRKGSVVAALERDYEVLDRAAFLKRMGYEAMPAVFEDAFPP